MVNSVIPPEFPESGVRPSYMSGDYQSEYQLNGWNNSLQPLVAKPHRFTNRCHPATKETIETAARRYHEADVAYKNCKGE